MTKQEAIQAMKQGKRVRHRFFSQDEWMTQYSNGQIIFEDGVKVNMALFWSDRTGPAWQDGWEIV